MTNEMTFENAGLLEEANKGTENGQLLDTAFLAALGSFVFAATYFLGTLF